MSEDAKENYVMDGDAAYDENKKEKTPNIVVASRTRTSEFQHPKKSENNGNVQTIITV
jgi:hypothetical protein